MSELETDFLVIGAGVAGLRAAIELSQVGDVLVVAKDSLRESSSEYAQGGIAVALNDDDEIELHEQDTLYAGDGLCDTAAVHTLVEEGPPAIRQLIAWGAQFDRDRGRLAFTREGAHSRNRVLHAHGDSTGREIARTLYAKASSIPRISFRSFSATTDLLLADGAVTGALVYDAEARLVRPVRARAVLLATGGLGHVFLHTTNPDVATGDGVAIAYRAGAEIADIEFIQFHPTALAVAGAPRFLLSEALRGEGAFLRNRRGERFVERAHPLKELAPRDVVARAIHAEMARQGEPCVYLDLTHREPGFVRRRFPRIYETCLRYGVDLERQLAPAAPAAHYAMGGVMTDLDGRTTLPGLFAAGEAACTGVHGANRLASNSLLEGVVFGARAGRAMRQLLTSPLRSGDPPAPPSTSGETASADEVRKLAWESCGIVRNAESLIDACLWIEEHVSTDPVTRNMLQVVLLACRAALARQESRGAHFRSDFPAKYGQFAAHSVLQRHRGISFRKVLGGFTTHAKSSG